MVVEKKNACTSEPLAKNVHIHPNQPDVWRISKVKGKTGEFTITAYSRKAPCLRFLGGSSKCDNRYVQLYAKDDGSGQQRWAITLVNPPKPTPSPSASLPLLLLEARRGPCGQLFHWNHWLHQEHFWSSSEDCFLQLHRCCD